jgi:hypothetical protein
MNKNMQTVSKILSIISVSGMILTGCSKSGINAGNQNAASNATPPAAHHVYGLQAPDPARYSKIPVYNVAQINAMFKTDRLTLAPAASTYSLATPAVRDQEQIGSCTGFTGSEANEVLRYYANGNSFGPILSPLYLYYIERVKIQGQKITVDQGAQMVDIPEALQGYGQCIETDYAYPTNANNTATASTKAYKTAPTSAAVSNALGYEIGAGGSKYGMVAQGDTASVKALLRKNIPVCMGFNVYDNSSYTIFEGLNTTNYTYSPLATTGKLKSGLSLLGGHANIIYGYDDTKGVFLMENSWNTTWGNKGFWYLPYSVFMSSTIVPTGNVYWMSL